MPKPLSVLSRRDILKTGAAAALATPFVIRPASAAGVVTILGVPGLHLTLWENWTKMIAADTKGEVEVRYDPLGYAPAFAKIKTEIESKNYSTDLFYGDSPFPERLALDGLLERMPYPEIPGANELYPFARSEYLLEVFRTNWGVVGFNTNFVKAASLPDRPTWDLFLDPRWKNHLSWPDPRGFPVFIPIMVALYGENGWIDYCRKVDANVKTYHARWIDNRLGLQRGDAWITFLNLPNVYISSEIDKASVSGLPIMQPDKALGVLPVSIGLLKSAPGRKAAVRVLDLISTAKYTQVMMDIGLNPSNNPKNYPHPLPTKILSLNNDTRVGLKNWEDVQNHTLPVDWIDWAGKMDKYVAQWEAEVFKRRG